MPEHLVSHQRTQGPGVVKLLAGFRARAGIPFSSVEPQPSRHVAFVVGNAAYEHVRRLVNPSADARAMRMALERAGFDLVGEQDCIDLGYHETMRLFGDFEKRLAAAEVGLIYYSGHGVQVGGKNYLVPVDSRVTYRTGAAGLVSVNDLLARAQAALGKSGGKTCLLFLDACRTDPRAPSKPEANDGRGLAGGEALLPQPQGLAEIEIQAQTETFIAYATTPYTKAYDGKGALSPFTAPLVKYLGCRGLSLDGLMRWVGQHVRDETKGEQRPWSHGNLTNDFKFVAANWQPLIELGVLGAVVGCLSTWFTFDAGGFFLPLDDPRRLLSALPFSAVIAYGVLKWGRGTWPATVAAFVTTYLSYLLANKLLEPAFRNQPPLTLDVTAFLNHPGFTETVNAALSSGIVYAVGTVAAGAISSRALRRPDIFAFSVSIGGAVALLYIAVSLIVRFTEISSQIGQPATGAEWIVLSISVALWDALLAATSGYGYATYVPKHWQDVDKEDMSRPRMSIPWGWFRARVDAAAATVRRALGVAM